MNVFRLFFLLLLCNQGNSFSWKRIFKNLIKFDTNPSPTPTVSETKVNSINLPILGSKGTIFSPILLFLLSSSKCNASPLNEQRIWIKGPFFQGWLVRTVDHTAKLSFIFIVGSFSPSKYETYQEHYVFCSIHSPKFQKTIESFPSPESVQIKSSGIPNQPALNILWKAQNFGYFNFTESSCDAHFNFQDITLKFNATERIPWSKQNSRKGGPEGWLGYTSLLPCHYFVYTTGSTCKYSIHCGRKTIHGEGITHIEGNYGSFFPEGWIWSQGVGEGNSGSFSLVAGKFVIGVIAPLNCILYVRRRNGENVVFRTSDLDRMELKTSSIDGTVRIDCTSILKQSSAEVVITPQKGLTPAEAFKTRVFIPTALGFSNNPGCRETYTAVAKIKLKNKNWVDDEEYEFPLTALEYGNSFVSKLPSLK